MSKRVQQPRPVMDMLPANKQPKKSEPIFKKWLRYIKQNQKLIVIVLVVVAVAVVATWWVTTGHKSKEQKDLSGVKNSLSRHILLPSNEEPTLATVTDKKQLKGKFLSTNANTGDRILIYTQNQIVIIYRPSIDKIVAVGTVTADSALAEAKGSTLTVMNGSKDPSKTQAIIDKIKAAYPDITVTDGGSTNKQDFPTTVVVDSTNQKDYLTDALAQISGGKRGVVPISEAKADTDLMIIVGTD